MGLCLSGSVGQGELAEEALKSIFEAALEANIRPGMLPEEEVATGPSGKAIYAYPDIVNGNEICLFDDSWPDFMALENNRDDFLFDSLEDCCDAKGYDCGENRSRGLSNNINATTGAHAVVVRGLNAALPGATIPNSEGMYYCVFDNNTEAESFFWVQNCDVLADSGSGNQVLCEDLTEAEAGVGTIGYVVDKVFTGTSVNVFMRYVFNETHAFQTTVQPLTNQETGFSCSGRPWFQTAMQCSDPAKVLCPTDFEGTTGLGTFQVYGDSATGVVASQDIPTWQLCQCLDDLSCDDVSPADSEWMSLRVSRFVLLCSSLVISVQHLIVR